MQVFELHVEYPYFDELDTSLGLFGSEEAAMIVAEQYWQRSCEALGSTWTFADSFEAWCECEVDLVERTVQM